MRSSRRNRLGLVVAILCLVGGGVAAALALTGGRNSGSKSSHEVTSTIIAEWRFAEGKGTLTSNAPAMATTEAWSQRLGAWAPPASLATASCSLPVAESSSISIRTSTSPAPLASTRGSSSPRGRTQPDDPRQATYALRVSSTGRIGLQWGGRWLQSRPLGWSPGTWYHLQIVNDGQTTRFTRNGSSAGSVSTPGPTSTSSFPLLIGSDLHGAIGYLALSSPPDRVPPAVVGATLGSSSVTIGSSMTLNATVYGSWANPDDPSQVDVSATVTAPSNSTQTVPGFMYQRFTVTSGALVPTGTPNGRYVTRQPQRVSIPSSWT